MRGLRRFPPAIVLAWGAVLAVGGAARAATTDPADIPGLQLWLDATDVTDGGTEPNDNDPLAAWVDKSTNARAVSQGTPDHRPTYRTNQLNGLPVVVFDGTDDNLARASTAMVAREIFAVAMCESSPVGLAGLLGRGVDDDENIRLQDATSYKGNANTDGNDFTRSGGTFKVNGVVTDDFTPDVAHCIHAIASDDRTYGDFAVGDGRANDPWRPWKGFIAEIIIYNRVLTGSERSSIEEYLRNKWLPGGLVAHWQFDGDATDSAGSYDGTLIGDPTWEPVGKISGAIDLDGTGDYVDVPDGLADFTGGFTVAVWAYPTAATNWARFIDFGGGQASDNIVFARNGGSNDLTLEVYTGATGGGQVTAPGAIDLDQWQHFAATIDTSGNVVIYKNGAEIQTGTTDVPADVTRTQNYIGESNWGADDSYEGQIDDLRVYDRALWPEEIAGLAAGLDPGLVAHWKLDEAAGATQADDATGNGNHGTPVEGATSGSSGRIGGAWDFDGDDYIAVPDTVINYLEGTICGWVRLHGPTGGAQRLFGTSDSPCRYYLFVDSSGVVKGRIRDVGAFGNQSIAVGEWHHIAVTWVKNGPGTVYVDGVERGSNGNVGGTSAPTNSNIGSFNRQTDNTNLNGLADDVRVYDRALTAAELQGLFDRGNVKVDPASALVTTEDDGAPGHSATFTVVLGSVPAAEVTVDISSSDTGEGVIEGATAGVLALVFTPSDWDTPQTVTVTGVDDADHDGHVAYTVDLAVSSADENYDGSVRTASVTNRDDEMGTNLVAWWKLDGDEGPPSISSSAPTTAVVGQAYVYNIDAWGLPALVTLDVDIPSPSGDWLSLNSGTELSGTPSAAAPTEDITVTAENALGSVEQVFQVTSVVGELGGLQNVVGTYYNNVTVSPPVAATRADMPIDFGFGFPPGVNQDDFSVSWVGEIVAPFDGTYTFYTSTDDGARLWVDGTQLVDDWTDHGEQENTGSPTLDLTAGQVVPFTFEFYDQGGAQAARLRWQGPSIAKEIIPAAKLYYTQTPPADPVFGTAPDFIAEDSIGGNDGTLTNMTGLEWRAGQIIGALKFDGTNDHVLVPDSTGISVTGDLTVAAWINATSWPANANIVAKDSDASYRFRIQDSGNTLWLRLVDGAGNEAEQVGYGFSTGTWYHVAATADLGAGEVMFYVNGSQVGATQTTARTSIVDSAGPLRIGTYGGSSENFDGLLDDVRIYDRVLTGLEVQGLYERGFTTVRPTYGLVTSEDPAAANHTATFEVFLNSAPAADVTISLSSSDTIEGTIDGASANVLILTFTPSGPSAWNVPQTVTVTGWDDDVADGDAVYTIVLSSTSSTDATYDGLDVADVSLININDDTAGITVTPTTAIVTTEAGPGTATFTVVLECEPTDPVTVDVGSSDTTEGEVSPAQLVFTDSTWATEQTVTVSGVDDDVDDGNIDYTVSFTVASTGGEYDGFTVPDIAARNIDDDTAGITVSAASVLTTDEGGGTATFTVVLDSEPTADVTIAIQSSAPDEGTLSAAVLTFTASGPTAWDTPHEVTVTGENDDFGDGDVDYTILFGPASSADGFYRGRQLADIAAINLDDEPVVTVAAASPDTTNEDGSSPDASFTVSLSHNSPGTVAIHFTTGGAATRGAGADYQLYAGGVLVPDVDDRFDITGGATSIDVTVRAIQDDFGEGNEAVTFTVAHAPDDDTYRYTVSGAGRASSTIIDDEPKVTVVASAPLASEPAVPGEFTVTRTMAFRTGDAFDIHYTLSGTATAGADYVVSPASPVTIPAGVASVAVTVSPVDDRRQEGDETATLAIVRNGALGYTVGSWGQASVTIADDERPGIGGGTGCAPGAVPAGGAGAAWGIVCLAAAAFARRRAGRAGSRL